MALSIGLFSLFLLPYFSLGAKGMDSDPDPLTVAPFSPTNPAGVQSTHREHPLVSRTATSSTGDQAGTGRREEIPQPVATVKETGAPRPWAKGPSAFWKELGRDLLAMPAPSSPTDDAHLVVARHPLALHLSAPDNSQAAAVTATLTFYEIRGDLQMRLDFTEPRSYRYLGVTGPQQIEIAIPGTEVEQAQRLPVERCGLIHVLAMNGAGETRLVFRFTPAGAFDLLTQPQAEILYARIYKDKGLSQGNKAALADGRAKTSARVKNTQVGVASWYGSRFHGRRTASGERFNMHANTAAHRSLPLGTKARVTNLQNGKSTVVRINDRGPFSRRRILDVSRGVAERLGFRSRGLARVKVEVLETDSGRR